MNFPRINVKNLLFLPNGRDYAEEMYGELMLLASAGKTVAVLTQCGSTPKLLPLAKRLGIEVYKNKQALQRLIFICCENVGAAVKKLLDLHAWRVKPNIIVIDLYTFVTSFAQDISKLNADLSYLQTLVQCISILFNLMDCLKDDRSKQGLIAYHLSPTIQSKVFSVVVLQNCDALLTFPQVELISDLYYSSHTYGDFRKIVDVISLATAN
ncbi:uncharacterized protein LOC118743480 isoform X1 [Rhagoletis pomonella]|uniref:uncharacterized protein LOC118743480 isoform X1 n=1 Tax=Rhagoletis pomonella TaxID=28610 RepID=UPI001785AE9E|nr:uncharacterized protein LOC118743480 isoform X1 [Rhagoletis pomonella]